MMWSCAGAAVSIDGVPHATPGNAKNLRPWRESEMPSADPKAELNIRFKSKEEKDLYKARVKFHYGKSFAKWGAELVRDHFAIEDVDEECGLPHEQQSPLDTMAPHQEQADGIQNCRVKGPKCDNANLSELYPNILCCEPCRSAMMELIGEEE
jgi:hypothetical protein